jgi:hypothetical protein
MILNDLFESRMSDLDIQYQDYKNLNDGGFHSRYKMTKDAWAGKNWSLIKSRETVHEGAVKNLYTDLAEKYRELAPSIEKYKDSFLAGQLYDALEAIAIEHDAELEFKRMMTGARNRAHMDYDTNPGGFKNWFWYLPFAEEQLDEKQDACYRKVKSRYKVWPSAYASGALVQCRKKGAANWGNKSKK